MPAPGETGMAMSLYLTDDDLAKLDEVRETNGLRRNRAIRQLIQEAYERLPRQVSRR